MARYVVTGGAGFIGSHLVDRLLQREDGAAVTVVDNFSSGQREFLQQHASNKNSKDLTVIEADLLDKERLTSIMRGHDAVFHLAANPDIKNSASNPELDFRQGTMATWNVLEAMRANGIKKIVFSSSSAVYGEAEAMPIPETCPLFPISHYGASKAACEAMISAYAHLYGMQAWICRFANVVGRRGTHGIIYDFIQKVKKATGSLEILGDGTQKKSYLLAEDIVDAMLFVLGNAKEQVNIFNLASSSSITVQEITEMFAAAVQQKTGNALKLNYTGGDRGWKGDVPLVILDPARLEKLGWKARYSSAEAVKMAIGALLNEQGV